MTRREIGRVTVLTNPASGHGNAPHAAEKAIERLQQRGIDVVAIVGSDAEHARRLLQAAVEKGTDAVVVTGGDGVISDALQALACTEIPLGIIPAGTGNDHAREFGLPTKDPVAAADVVADGWTETVDLGRIRDRTGATKWFGTVAAAGFDSLVTDRANRMRWPRGRMRYNLAMLAELSQLRLLPFRLVLDGRDEIVTDLTLAAFGNTRSYGGGMLICPNADHADGQLDITMVHSASRTRLIRLFPTVYKGSHVDLDEVTTARATSVDVESPGINAYADGEYACALPAEISAVSGRAADLCGLTDSTAEPGHLGAVTAVAIHLERLIPGRAQRRIQLGGQRVGAVGHHRPQPHLADHHVAVGAHRCAPQSQLGRVAEPLPVDAGTGILGDFEPQHRPGTQGIGQPGAGAHRTDPIGHRTQLSGHRRLRGPLQVGLGGQRRRQRPLDMRTHRGGRGVDVHHAGRHVGELVRRTHLLLLRLHEGRLPQRPGEPDEHDEYNDNVVSCVSIVPRETPVALVRDALRYHGIGERRPQRQRPLTEIAVGEHHQRELRFRICPDKRARLTEMAVGARRIFRAGPMR